MLYTDNYTNEYDIAKDHHMIHETCFDDYFFFLSDSEVQFLVPSKQVDLNTKNCYLSDGTAVPCVDIEVTLEYSGVGVPDQIGNLSISTYSYDACLKVFIH